jgi:hypothetical protein
MSHRKTLIEKIPPTGKKAKPQKQCVVCQKHGKRRDTTYWCPDCQTGRVLMRASRFFTPWRTSQCGSPILVSSNLHINYLHSFIIMNTVEINAESFTTLKLRVYSEKAII